MKVDVKTLYEGKYISVEAVTGTTTQSVCNSDNAVV